MNGADVTLTADLIAHGLIAACRRFGADPLAVFDRSRLGGGKARACVGAVLKVRLEQAGAGKGATRRVAAMLKLPETTLYPSNLIRAGLAAEDMAAIEAAMSAVKPWASTPDPRPRRPRPSSRFDASKLGGGKVGRVAPKLEEIEPVREDDVRVGPEDSLRRMFGDDRKLVEACRRGGGFPIFHSTGPLKGTITPVDPKTWSHG